MHGTKQVCMRWMTSFPRKVPSHDRSRLWHLRRRRVAHQPRPLAGAAACSYPTLDLVPRRPALHLKYNGTILIHFCNLNSCLLHLHMHQSIVNRRRSVGTMCLYLRKSFAHRSCSSSIRCAPCRRWCWWMSYVHFTRYGTFMMAKETRKHRIYGHQQAGDVPRGGIFLRPAPGVRVDFFRLPMSWSMARRCRGLHDPGIT